MRRNVIEIRKYPRSVTILSMDEIRDKRERKTEEVKQLKQETKERINKILEKGHKKS